MRIFTNVNSYAIQNSLDRTISATRTSLERLASGLRINRAGDDAAGLSLSEGLRSQIRGNRMAQRNSNDGLAMLQIAESGTQQITDSLQRMRELALQASNGAYSNTDRGYLQQEYSALASEISRIATATTYNGIPLLASTTAMSFQVSSSGTGAGASIAFNPSNLSTGLSFGGVSTQSAAQSAVASVDTVIGTILGFRSRIGATMNRLESTVFGLGDMVTNLLDADSRIRDADFAFETMQFTKHQILIKSGESMLGQANQLPSAVLKLMEK
ncbi:MAG TPA: flagellin [Fibrobacteria bacterium]|nr:flagellin [Fibrobacteria bacterium]HOX51917.1 flagellin [Fibrobacteria bacterium]